jgi:hypothetical protein
LHSRINAVSEPFILIDQLREMNEAVNHWKTYMGKERPFSGVLWNCACCKFPAEHTAFDYLNITFLYIFSQVLMNKVTFFETETFYKKFQLDFCCRLTLVSNIYDGK